MKTTSKFSMFIRLDERYRVMDHECWRAICLR